MYRCEEIPELISAELDGELTPEQSGELHAHLESCGACMALFLELRQLHEAMSGISVQAPEGFAGAVMERVSAAGGKAPAAKKRNGKWKMWGGLAAVLILTVLGAGRLILPGLGGSASAGTAAAPAYDTAESGQTTYTSNTSKNGDDAGAQESETYAGIMNVQPDQVPAPSAETAQSRSVAGSGGGEYQDAQSGDTSEPDEAAEEEAPRALFAGAVPGTDEKEPGAALTALDAGYLVLQAADPDGFDSYQPSEESGCLVFLSETGSGDASLAYTGTSEDGSRYEFVFTASDGSLQHWSAAVDGSSVGRS